MNPTDLAVPFSPLIEQAIELASEWHDQTYRKSKWRKPAFGRNGGGRVRTPVMAHLTAVAMTLQRVGWDDATVAAGFLHDILEDENSEAEVFSFDQLVREMGAEVADYVRGVTEMKKDPLGRWYTWQDRKEQYLEQLENGTVSSLAISLADKLHNLWSMNQALSKGIDIFSNGEGRRALSAGPVSQRWYFESVLEIADQHNDPRLHPLKIQLQDELDRFISLTEPRK